MWWSMISEAEGSRDRSREIDKPAGIQLPRPPSPRSTLKPVIAADL